MDFSLENFPFKRFLLCGLILLCQIDTTAQDTLEISELEYFFDVDPGVGSATSIIVSPDSLVSSVESLVSSGLSVGFHQLGFRARNLARVDSVSFDSLSAPIATNIYIGPLLRSSGQWGITETRLVYVDPSETGGIILVDSLEYFFDVDPGVGSATIINSFSAANFISISEILNSNTLEFGFHSLGMRVKAVGGSWGMTETRLVFVDQSDSGNTILVDSIEYFFDEDPGVGSATVIDGFAASTLVNSNEMLVSNGLAFGFHSLGMRVKAVGRSWGMTETRLVFVDQSGSGNAVLVDSLEYFFDVDPGVGSATIIDGFVASTLISSDELLISNSLALGFHSLGMRAKAVGGSWGTTETRLIFVDPSSSGGIINVDQVEYFFDVDPGVGSATLVSAFSANDLISLGEVLNTSALSTGFHVLGMRARAEGGSWGPIESRLIYVDPGITQSDIIQLEYFIDVDPGFGAATNIPVSIPDSTVSESVSIDISGFPNGTHGIHVRALNDLGEWSLIETDTFRIVNIGGPIISSLTGDTTNATPINILVSFDREVVGFDETDIAIFGNGRLQAGSFVDNGDGTFNISLDSLNEGVIELFIPAASANALDDNSPTPAADTLKIIYDITAPQVTVSALATIETSPALSGTVNDILSTVEITLDGNTYTAVVAADSTWTLGAGAISPTLSDGIYEVDVTATDVAGNIGVDGTASELTIDTTSPNVTISALITSARSPELNGTIDELTISLDVDVDGNVYSGVNNGDGTWTLSAGSISPDLVDGVYEVAVTATDPLGNVGTDASAAELTIDNVAPTIAINTHATSIRSPELSGTVDDLTATISIEVDGTSYSGTNNGDGTWTLMASTISPDLTDAVYDVIATATDVAGNVGNDATIDELTITTDILAIPAIAITSTSFQANWSQGLDVKEYRIDVSDQADFSTFLAGYENLNAGTSIGIFVSPLEFGTNYYYRVRLVNTSDEVSENSNTISVKTIIDPETESDSTALVQIYNALGGSGWSPSVNWTSARLRDWDGVALSSTRTRVEDVTIAGAGATGDMTNPFTGDAVGGLTKLLELDISNNQITGLMDFSGTSIANLDVSGNRLHFDDLEPVVGITTLDYSNQASVKFNEAVANSIEVRYDTDFNLSVTIGGSNNLYQWYRDGLAISTDTAFTDKGDNLDILTIDYYNMGEFNAEVTNTIVTGLTINVDVQSVLAIADFEVRVVGSDDQAIAENVNGALLEAFRRSKGFDTLEVAPDVASTFTFPDVVLGNYLTAVSSDLEKYIGTYSGDEFLWENADTIFFRNDDGVDIKIQEVPEPSLGEGIVSGIIETNFADENGRIDARRRAARRKCGLRRRGGGGRTEVDDDGFVLIAYGETNDNGEFEYGELPEGTYRFFVEYPGIPLDPDAFVEFDVGEAGISQNEFVLAATISENGIEVELIETLGVIHKYFKDLQIYPNPSNEVLNISYRHLTTDEVRVELLNLTGSILFQQDLEGGYDRDLNVNVSDFEEGIYLLRFYDKISREKNMMSYRIIIKH